MDIKKTLFLGYFNSYMVIVVFGWF